MAVIMAVITAVIAEAVAGVGAAVGVGVRFGGLTTITTDQAIAAGCACGFCAIIIG